MAKDDTELLELINSMDQDCIQYFQDVKARHNGLPVVTGIQEKLRWMRRAIENEPAGAAVFDNTEMMQMLRRDKDALAGALSLYQPYQPQLVFNVGTATTSGAIYAFNLVTNAAQSSDPALSDYGSQLATQYKAIQAYERREDQVRQTLTAHCRTAMVDRFDRAKRAYYQAISDVGAQTQAAAEIRTLIDGMQGEVWCRVSRPGEQKAEWGKIAQRLSGGDEIKRTELIRQGVIHKSLVDKLSPILKDRVANTSVDLPNIWAMALDHVLVVGRYIDSSGNIG